ncbi:MAG: HAD family hydrolase [Deltaproteobacteria bacterium]|nr:HAD family hydrolase [Deltaproteobacteria bacterium]
MRPIQAVGFDLFNTLITVERGALEDAVGRLVQSLVASGLAVDGARFVEDHRSAALRFIEETRRDGRETHNRFWIQAALEVQGVLVSPEDPRIAEGVEAYFSAFLDHVRVIPGTLEMLETVGQRYRVGLLSNFTHTPAARAILEAVGLAPHFEVCVISGEIGFRKPHARAFEALLSELGVASPDMLYVGDDPEADVAGGLQSGLRPVWSTYVRDRGMPFAPGYDPGDQDLGESGVPRISDWADLIALLDEEHPPC